MIDEAPKRGPKAADKNQIQTKGHDFDGFIGGRCKECGLRDTHPVHHKKDLNEKGWPKNRKPDRVTTAPKKAPPASKTEE